MKNNIREILIDHLPMASEEIIVKCTKAICKLNNKATKEKDEEIKRLRDMLIQCRRYFIDFNGYKESSILIEEIDGCLNPTNTQG